MHEESCPSYGEQLIDVNNAKTEFVRRPHFRHPDGSHRDECLVMAARAAALRQLQDDGWLEPPRRKMPGRVAGLGGKFHEAWVELPPERKRISEVDYRDRSSAVVTFDDGEQVVVQLIGAAGADLISGQPVPTIYVDTDDPRLAGRDLEELRKQARLIPPTLPPVECGEAAVDDVVRLWPLGSGRRLNMTCQDAYDSGAQVLSLLDLV